MRLQVILVVAGLLGAAPLSPAVAADAAPAILLPVEGDGSIATLGLELERALARLGRPVQRSSLPLDEAMLAVGCAKPTVACLQNIGQSVKAGALVLARARRVQDQVELALRWFDVRSGTDLGQALQLLPLEATAREPILGGAARELLGLKASRPGEPMGALSISASVPYAEVLIDGQSRGAVPLELRRVRAGTYRVAIRHDGFGTWEGQARVKPDQLTRLEVDLLPLPRGASGQGYFESIRTRTWVLAGGGLVAFVVGAAFAAHLRAQQNHLDDTAGTTPDEIRRMKEYRETGERDALAANIAFGIGGATIAAAAVLSYLDYRRGRAEARPAERSRLLVGPSSVRLRLEF